VSEARTEAGVDGIVRVDGMATAAGVAKAIRGALAAGGELVVELDGARHLDDEIATVLRRALAAARASGVEARLVARRAGPRRWLARHGLEGAS
jgi:anti-anti-sigma regulatory factor